MGREGVVKFFYYLSGIIIALANAGQTHGMPISSHQP